MVVYWFEISRKIYICVELLQDVVVDNVFFDRDGMSMIMFLYYSFKVN